jgi:integrase
MPELRDVMGRQKLATDAFELSHGWRPRFVFFHEDGSQVAGLQKAWEKARKRVGLEAKIQHDFRRTAIRNLVRAGVSESTSMKLCGHKTRKIFDRYSIVSEHDLREGVAKLAALHEHETPQIG